MQSFFKVLVLGWMVTFVLGAQSLPSQSPWTEVFKTIGSTSMGFSLFSIDVGSTSMSVEFDLSYPETLIPIGNKTCGINDAWCSIVHSYIPEDSPWFHANESAPKRVWTSNVTGEYCMDQVKFLLENQTELALNYSFVQVDINEWDTIGILGFGFANQEYTNQGKGGYIYDNFMETLKKSPLRALFTIFTSSIENDESTLLFGAIDSAKYDHDIGFRTYDVYSPLSYGKEGPPTDWGIVMDEFTVYDESNEDSLLEIDTSNYTTVVDGLTYDTFLAPGLFQQFIELFNVTYSEEHGYYAKPEDIKDIYITLTFGDLEYSTPLVNTSFHPLDGKSLLKILPNNEDYNIIGLPMLRNDGYVVYDYENRTVSLGKLKVNDGEVDLNEDIVTISNTLPDSKKVTDVPKETRYASASETDSTETDSNETDASETEESSDSSETSEPNETSTSSGFGTKTTAKWSLLTLILFYLM